MSESVLKSLDELLRSIGALRQPETGCPWDIQQTQESLISYVIEEAYEVSDAILDGDQKKICDELGDYLYQVLIQCQIAEEQGHFSLDEVITNLNKKLIRRHPHVFAGEKVSSVEDVKRLWQDIKKREGAGNHVNEEVLLFKKSISRSPLKASQVIGDITHEIKFDWESWSEVYEKVEEEWLELQLEMNCKPQNLKAVEHELGDLIFTLAQLARHLKIDSELAVQKANQRFRKRFEIMVKLSGLSLHAFNELPRVQKEQWYQRAKKEPTKD